MSAPNHNGKGGMLLSQHLSDVNAVQTRNTGVENDRVKGVRAGEGNSSWAVRSGQNLVPLCSPAAPRRALEQRVRDQYKESSP